MASFLFSIFAFVSYTLLDMGLDVWRRTESSQEASSQLQKARYALRRDLTAASLNELSILDSPEGSILWFLSPMDTGSEELALDLDGAPLWQRNVIYYTAVPEEHDTLFPGTCSGDPDVCPHKLLIRRELDTGVTTHGNSPLGRAEELLSEDDLLAEVLRPRNMVEGLDVNSSVVARNIFEFEVSLDPDNWREVEIKVSGFHLEEAGKKVDLRNLEEVTPYIKQIRFVVYPLNTKEK